MIGMPRLRKSHIVIAAVVLCIILFLYAISTSVSLLNYILNPPARLSLSAILLISLILGILHGATPDEHTWPITFSYAVGSYSTKGGMKAGFAFSSGFTIQRAFLTTLGFLGLAAIYRQYNLDGYVYVVVGAAMVLAGAYVLKKRKYIHIPIDMLLGGSMHHTEKAARLKPDEEGDQSKIPMKLAVVHGLIAGFGFGPYSTIITFILAPMVSGLIFAPLPGLFFGLGTMIMQIIFGAIFSSIGRQSGMSEKEIASVGRKTAGRTLYYGGMLFAIIGLFIVFFPAIDNIAISTGNPIPNLDSVGVATLLVLGVVGVFGIGNLIYGMHDMLKRRRKAEHAGSG